MKELIQFIAGQIFRCSPHESLEKPLGHFFPSNDDIRSKERGSKGIKLNLGNMCRLHPSKKYSQSDSVYQAECI